MDMVRTVPIRENQNLLLQKDEMYPVMCAHRNDKRNQMIQSTNNNSSAVVQKDLYITYEGPKFERGT